MEALEGGDLSPCVQMHCEIPFAENFPGGHELGRPLLSLAGWTQGLGPSVSPLGHTLGL